MNDGNIKRNDKEDIKIFEQFVRFKDVETRHTGCSKELVPSLDGCYEEVTILEFLLRLRPCLSN